MTPTTILLVRHATHDRVGSVLCGRMPDVTLGDAGRAQAFALARHLGRGATLLQTSPLERCVETAAILSETLGCAPSIVDAITEIDFGAWTGRSFAALSHDPAWRHWNEARDDARAPGGESAREAQARAIRHIAALHERHTGQAVVIVTHADIIRSVLAHLLGLPLQSGTRLAIEPGSVSRIAIDAWSAVVRSMNELPAA